MRFPGSFGSAYLYYVVPKVILFRTEHSRRTLVPQVDFISAPGGSAGERLSPGRPDRAGHQPLPVPFDRRAAAIHAGERPSRPHCVEEVADHTGFAYDSPNSVPTTPAPSEATLAMLRQDIAPQLAEVYPQFTAALFGAT